MIISINGNQIDDFIGLQFHSSEPELVFVVQKPGEDGEREIVIRQDWQNKLGIEPEPYKLKECCNNCIFCFIDQMPQNLRNSLYVKDDDYLFSFVYGNYISLNNLSERELQRIVEERLSPLYVSVHTSDPVLRKRVMGYRREMNIMERLSFLSAKGISFHTQIVVMPGINDDEQLEKTISDLCQPGINTLSIGLVPVGLTKYRKGLYPLKPVTPIQARKIISFSNRLVSESGFSQLYCADELFILAEEKIPGDDYYADFCQIENGIGMIRALLDNWRKKRERFIESLKGKSTLFVTGMLARKFLSMIAGEISKSLPDTQIEVLGVKNRFFGETITVSGLLTFHDIREELRKLKNVPEIVVLSSNMFNPDGLTIDGVHREQIKSILNRDVLIADELLTDWEFV
jgi:putative radical SAM enzyme (TIGR03279 family)